ncbi:hypothetical protein [Brucella rhizosphaerae]|uniref:hypothetical protein n=1 Tax=Brucella rhizosphaerae TaxID=571254 RepID=UPI000B981600|nr:hypothetical protein [Brucella rhizosphaerae]
MRRIDLTVEGNTHLGAGKIISESGDLTLDTGTLTHENFSGSKQYEGFDVQANIDLIGKQQQPEQTAQPNNTAEGTYQLDDTRQEVRATVGPGEIIIRDKDKQAELEASGQTEDVAALNRDPDKAYEVTKDKHVEIEYYLSDTSLKVLLQKFGQHGALLNSGRNYAASAVNCCLRESAFVKAKMPCCLRIM